MVAALNKKRAERKQRTANQIRLKSARCCRKIGTARGSHHNNVARAVANYTVRHLQSVAPEISRIEELSAIGRELAHRHIAVAVDHEFKGGLNGAQGCGVTSLKNAGTRD